MITALGIIVFIIGCCLSSSEDNSYKREQEHKELMRALSESRQDEAPVRHRRTHRRMAKDKEGNMIAEEIIEETEQ